VLLAGFLQSGARPVASELDLQGSTSSLAFAISLVEPLVSPGKQSGQCEVSDSQSANVRLRRGIVLVS